MAWNKRQKIQWRYELAEKYLTKLRNHLQDIRDNQGNPNMGKRKELQEQVLDVQAMIDKLVRMRKKYKQTESNQVIREELKGV